MDRFLAPLGAKAKAMASFFSSRSSSSLCRHVTTRLLYHGHHAKTGHQRLSTTLFYRHQCRQYSTTPKKSDPLHILFCGSDKFSCASLRALHVEHTQNPDLIRSIDVVVRPGKRTGRGQKIIRDPPIRSLATSLGLQVHERDTFTGWDMPQEINLIIAVSFGLFVPPRLLQKAKYGGLNIHPSLLPDLRGPAPLQHALLARYALTGVSLQTLDDKAFDHGIILAQTPSDPEDRNALHIPASITTTAALQALVTPAASSLLIKGLRANLHVPPLEAKKQQRDPSKPLLHAPKITTQDRQLTLSLLRTIDAETSNPSNGQGTLARRQDAIGRLWFLARNRQGQVKRVMIQTITELPGLSPANRPGMISHKSSSDDNTTNTNTGTSTSHPQRTYEIPFLEQVDSDEQGSGSNTATESSQKEDINLVFWEDPDTAARIPGQLARGDAGLLNLGNYCVHNLQVEGEREKPAWIALRQFTAC
ncbi:formyl transferase [Xylaria intraflava]|nr:formyl transferase [Xylaria intraflava]